MHVFRRAGYSFRFTIRDIGRAALDWRCHDAHHRAALGCKQHIYKEVRRKHLHNPLSDTVCTSLLFHSPAGMWGRGIRMGQGSLPQPAALGALAYQCVVVAFIGYLVWFRLLHRYQASRLVSFIFLTPVFGVILSGLLLGESLTLSLWTGLGMVAAGIYLVNRPTSTE